MGELIPLSKMPKPNPPNCLIEPGLLPSGGIMTVIGEPGVGKSKLVQQMCFEIANGERVLGLFPAKEGKVAYFEFEKRSDMAKARFWDDGWWARYPKAPSTNLAYYDERVLKFDNPADVVEMTRLLKDFDAKLFVVDSFATAILDDVELGRLRLAVERCREMVKEVKMSAILIQHIVKRGVEFNKQTGEYVSPPLRMDDMKGSKHLEYEVDTIMGVTKSRKGWRNIAILKHSHTPIQYSELEPIRFQACFGDPIPFKTQAAEVMHALDSGGSIDSLTLQQQLKISRPTLNNILDRLEELGLTETIHTGGGGGGTSQFKSVTRVLR